MATYKVLQDIEAEDKLFGPFTLKQFIFGGVTAIILFILFQVAVSPMPIFIKVPVVSVFLPPLLLFGFMAAPIARDQPNDIWLLARLRFLFKPRTRIWSQDGISELVTITAPKKDTRIYTNSLSQVEVKSRLQALANTVDTRGWATKNVNTNLFTQPDYIDSASSSDRLVAASELPQDTALTNVTAADDMLDPLNNSTAQYLDSLIQKSSSTIKQQAISQMSAPTQQPQAQTPQNDYWFMNQPQTPAQQLPQDYATFDSAQVVQPGVQAGPSATQATPEEEALAKKLAQDRQESLQQTIGHMKVIDPNGTQPAPAPGPTVQQPQTTAQTQPHTPSPTAQQLAQNNDLDIATLARQANKTTKPDDDEVVISLH